MCSTPHLIMTNNRVYRSGTSEEKNTGGYMKYLITHDVLYCDMLVNVTHTHHSVSHVAKMAWIDFWKIRNKSSHVIHFSCKISIMCTLTMTLYPYLLILTFVTEFLAFFVGYWGCLHQIKVRVPDVTTWCRPDTTMQTGFALDGEICCFQQMGIDSMSVWLYSQFDYIVNFSWSQTQWLYFDCFLPKHAKRLC